MNYYEEIKSLVRKYEVNSKSRYYKDNSEKIETNYNIGRLIVEAQGGSSRAKYGNELIKEWAIKLTKLYGNNYSERKLRDYRMFFLTFPIWHPVDAISWSHIRILLPIKTIILTYVLKNNFLKENLYLELKITLMKG